MSLKSKAALIFLGIFVVYGAADYAVQQFVVLPSFIALERNEARKDLERAVGAIKREVHHLNTFCWDWSAWDDTYAFMVSRSKKYIKSNLVLSTFTDNGINLIYFIDQGGEVIWGKIYDLKTEKPIKLTGFQKGAFQGNHSLIPQQKQTEDFSQISASGIVATEKGPMLVAARPILTSEDEGPSRGTLIMGRFLDDDLVRTLVDQSKVVFSIHPVGSDSSREPTREINGSCTSGSPYLFEKQGPLHLLVSTTFPDVEGNPAFLITARIPRTIFAKGYDTTRYAVISGFVSMFLVLIIMLFVLQRTILRPIIELKNHTLSIGKTGDLSARVSIGRQDEIGALGSEFDRMMEKLEERTDKLTELNREMKKDIARRIQAEEALRVSEEKYRTILESIEDGYYEVDIDGNFTFFNDSLCEIYGYPKNELMGMNIRKSTDQETAKQGYNVFNKVYTTGRAEKGFEWPVIRKDCTKRSVEASVSLRRDAEGEPIGFRGIVRDITEKQRLEAQLQQAQKMEVIGTLAGGIAHDFNNLMTSVLGNISLAKMEMKPESKAFRNLVEAEKASIQTKELTTRLITFSKGGEPVKETVSIGDLVKDAVGSSLQSSDISCKFSIPDDILPVEADEEQMKQVIHNVMTNAQEAMAGQGSINVSCENVDIGEKDTLTLKDGQYVKISIRDQGPGIPKKDLTKIFDPYFSTKEMGTQKGIGLGLAVSDSIVKKHDGLITVESELGRGTTLSIYLPAASAERQAPSAKRLEVDSQSTIDNRQSTIQRILVMDDEEMVRNVTAALLGHIGYEVELAVDGVEAIEMYKGAMESGKAYDAVILDLTNKIGMGGVETIERLLKIDPDVKAIVATGYSSDPILSNFREQGFCGSLSKPFTLDELKTVLSEVVAIE